MVGINFNASAYEPNAGGMEAWPEGWHTVIITKSEQNDIKENKGKLLALTIQTQDGKTQIDRHNVWHNDTAIRDRANQRLSKLCHILGVFNVGDTAELHNIPFQIRATVAKDDQGRSSNNFPDYQYANGQAFTKNPGGAPHGNPAQQSPQGFGQQPAPQGAPPQGFTAPPAGQQGFAPPQPGQAPGGFQPAPQGQPQQPWGGGQPAPQQGGYPPAQQQQPPAQQGFQQPQQPMPQQGGFAPPQGQGFAPPAGGGFAPPQGGQPGGPWGGPQR